MKNILITTIASLLLSGIHTMAQDRSVTMAPIPGAKLYFADKPFTTDHQGDKTTFNSSGFIYGRLELNGQSLQEAFGMSVQDEESPWYLRCWVLVFKNGQEIGQHQLWEFIHVKKGEQLKSSFNFDVLPEPAKASTAMSGDNHFIPAVAAGPLYQRIRPETFSANGEYTIKIRLYLKKFDAWDNLAPTTEWPMAQGEFKFLFDGKDVPAILKNYQEANKTVKAKLKF
jgi:hypothetical protein